MNLKIIKKITEVNNETIPGILFNSGTKLVLLPKTTLLYKANYQAQFSESIFETLEFKNQKGPVVERHHTVGIYYINFNSSNNIDASYKIKSIKFINNNEIELILVYRNRYYTSDDVLKRLKLQFKIILVYNNGRYVFKIIEINNIESRFINTSKKENQFQELEHKNNIKRANFYMYKNKENFLPQLFVAVNELLNVNELADYQLQIQYLTTPTFDSILELSPD